jgi:UDP-glucose 4-epimerase
MKRISGKKIKVLVFGGAGFLGSHVADALTDSEYDVTIFDIKPSLYLRKDQKMIVGNILEEAQVFAAVKGQMIVYNFAGIADIDVAMDHPLEAVKVNVLGNTIILEACRTHKVQRFVFASSLYVYSKSGSFYRASKHSCELIIESYSQTFGLPYTILRYGSLYGPRADDRNGIYKFINQALREGRIVRPGDGKELREYIHAQDAAIGSVKILSDEFKNQSVILTGHQQIHVDDLLHMIREMLNNKIRIEYVPAENAYHYAITPYTFAPKVAKRLLSSSYLDLGQGVLDCIYLQARELDTDQGKEFVVRRKK